MKMFVADALVEKLEAEVKKLYMRGHVAAEHHVQEHALNIVKAEPTVDAVPVVRCKECKHSVPIFSRYFVGCDMWKHSIRKDGFCHMGAKMDGGAEDG